MLTEIDTLDEQCLIISVHCVPSLQTLGTINEIWISHFKVDAPALTSNSSAILPLLLLLHCCLHGQWGLVTLVLSTEITKE